MKKVRRFIKNFINVLSEPEMLILPGQLAFFFFLSVVPIITLISYAASYLNLPIDFIATFLTNAFGSSTAEYIVPMVSGVTLSTGYIVTILVGYFIASNGASSMIITSNTIYGIKDSGFIKRRIKALVMTLFIVILFIFILVIPVFGDTIIDLIKFVNFNSTITKNIELIFNILSGPVSWFIIFFFIKILYTMAPDRKLPSSYVNYGAIFTSAGWILATFIYSNYINKFANYDIFYGGLANIIILMLWVYLLAFIFVIGLALNNRREINMIERTSQIEQIQENKI